MVYSYAFVVSLSVDKERIPSNTDENLLEQV